MPDDSTRLERTIDRLEAASQILSGTSIKVETMVAELTKQGERRQAMINGQETRLRGVENCLTRLTALQEQQEERLDKHEGELGSLSGRAKLGIGLGGATGIGAAIYGLVELVRYLMGS